MRALTTAVLVASMIAPALGAQRPMPSHGAAVAADPAQVVARVNGVPLTNSRLDAAINALIPLESFHRGVTPASMAEFRRRALERIVDDELQHLEGLRLGVTVTPAQVQQEVAALQKKYRGRAALESALSKSGATMADLRRELERTLVIQKTVRRAVTSRCQVSRQEASQYFAANSERFVVPEQLHVYAITVGVEPSAAAAQWADARQRAQDLRQQLTSGASFQELARRHSTDPSRASGGDMGLLHRGSMTEEFEQATRHLAVGQPSDVVQSLYGFHIVEIGEIRPPQRRTFAAVAAELQRDLTTKRCESMTASWIAGLRARATIVLAASEGA